MLEIWRVVIGGEGRVEKGYKRHVGYHVIMGSVHVPCAK